MACLTGWEGNKAERYFAQGARGSHCGKRWKNAWPCRPAALLQVHAPPPPPGPRAGRSDGLDVASLSGTAVRAGGGWRDGIQKTQLAVFIFLDGHMKASLEQLGE
ncbi:hypothetical protein AAFF_G00419950 [Aldrovandia affinis]|uniref:Uncharacterized protein n=1 Tax=Aldrovandia affinis TaxID=143900 RepID=A0AAD7SAF1_9TELE|nr:hypothetical protein AAFF_G00419950 [Aldrovandia affinis]